MALLAQKFGTIIHKNEIKITYKYFNIIIFITMEDFDTQLRMWNYFQSCPDINNGFCELMREVADYYCLDPYCNCSRSMMWKTRDPVDGPEYDRLPPDVKDILYQSFISLRNHDPCR